MTLNLAVKLSLDKTGFAAGAGEASTAVAGIGGAAKTAATEATAMQAAIVSGARAATVAAEAQSRAIQTIAEVSARASAAARRDSLGVAIERSGAATAADIALLGNAIADLRTRWDPLAAATERYRAALAELRTAHQVGAIDVETAIQRETELRTAYERTAATLADRARASKAMTDRAVGMQTIVPDRGADIAAYGAEMDALRAKYNPLWAAEQRHQQSLGDIRHAEQVGAISSAEAAAAIARTTAQHQMDTEALKRSEAAIGRHAGAMKLSAFQAQNLSYQLNDVAVSLASGMSPLTVLMQQGSQIAPIFGGVRGTLAAVGAVINPVTVGVAAAAVTIGVAAKAGLDYSAAMRDAATAATGMGRGAGTTAAEIDAIARSSADASRVSVSSAREMATEFAATGKIGSSLFGELIGLSKDFGATIGQDTTTAAKTLADLFADPGRGAQTLAQSYGLLDTTTAHLVQRMADQGRVTEAQTTLTAALRGRLVDAGDTVAWYAAAWDRLSRSISNYYDTLGRGAAGKADPVADLEARLAAARASAAARREAQPTANGIWGNLGSLPSNGADDAEVKRLEAELDAAKRRAADEQATARAQRSRGLDDQAIERGRSIAEAGQSSDTRQRQQLADELVILRDRQAAAERLYGSETRGTPAVEAQIAEATRGTAEAIARKTRALTTWISESDRNRQLAEIDIAMAQARDPIERAELERRRALVSAAGQEMTASEAAASANLAYARSIGEVVASTRGSIADAVADVAARTKVNALVASGAIATGDAARELQIEAQTRQLVAAAARAEGAEKERLLALADGLRSAMEAQAAAEMRAQTIADLASGRDRLETMQAEIALLGQSTAARARSLALLEAEQKIRSQGLIGGDAAAVRALAASTADLNTELERQKAAWGEIEQSGSSAVDTIVDGLMHGKDVSKQLVESLLSELAKLAITNPLKNGLFGENLPTIGDVGGLLSGRTQRSAAAGVMSSVATAQITAATVIVNGQTIGVGGAIAGAGGNFADGTGGLGATAAVSRSTLGQIGAANSNTIPTEAGRVFATGYSPQTAGDRVEGGLASSIRGPDGQALVRTLDDYRSGRSQYVTLAGNPAFYGRHYTMPEVSWTSGGQQYSLRDVPGVVHDTGSAFRSAPEGRFDVAVGRDLSYAERNQSMSSVQFAPAATQASDALTKFSTTTQSTDASLGTLGNSFTGFGQALSQAIGGAGAGGGGGGGGLFGGLFKLLGFRTGGVFAGGAVVPYATGTVVDRPTLFPIAGGKTGLMGEAGAEAIMPLARDGSGRLGIRAAMPTASGSSGQTGGVSLSMPVAIHNYAGADVTATMGTRSDGRREMQIQVRQLKRDMEQEYGLRRVRTTR